MAELRLGLIKVGGAAGRLIVGNKKLGCNGMLTAEFFGVGMAQVTRISAATMAMARDGWTLFLLFTHKV
jgi:hypothetical protein